MGVTETLEKAYLLGSRAHQGVEPTAAERQRKILLRLRAAWEEHKPTVDEVPELGFAEFLQRHWLLLQSHRRDFVAAAGEASAHARELTLAAEDEALPEAPPRDAFSIVFAGEGSVCTTFNFLLCAAGVRLTSGLLSPVAATRAFLDPDRPLPLPLHLLPAQNGKLTVRASPPARAALRCESAPFRFFALTRAAAAVGALQPRGA